jgi:hypothetical protein
MIALVAPRVWANITNAAKECRVPARVAVAYFGESGDRLLPLVPGSAIVVDASIPTVAAGATCPPALEQLRRKGTDIYSAQFLHAKVFVFDNLVFVGSANASRQSDRRLIEAVLRLEGETVTASAREFVESLCVTKLTRADLAELGAYYKRPRVPAPSMPPKQSKYSTLLMELTLEQGEGRETQVQPPKAVWQHYFGIHPGQATLPQLSLVNELAHPALPVVRRVVKHHHNYTIELTEAELPRPAILQMRRVGRNQYRYRIHRPQDNTFASIKALVDTLPNPLWDSGRRWVLI